MKKILLRLILCVLVGVICFPVSAITLMNRDLDTEITEDDVDRTDLDHESQINELDLDLSSLPTLDSTFVTFELEIPANTAKRFLQISDVALVDFSVDCDGPLYYGISTCTTQYSESPYAPSLCVGSSSTTFQLDEENCCYAYLFNDTDESMFATVVIVDSQKTQELYAEVPLHHLFDSTN